MAGESRRSWAFRLWGSVEAPDGWEEIKSFTGWRPEFLDDLAGWERTMVLVPPPAGCLFFYDSNLNGEFDRAEASLGLRVHPRIAEELSQVLQNVADAGLWSFVSSIAGGYNWRAQRGSKKLSTHALGLAVDFDPRRNPFKRIASQAALGTEPGLGVVRIFEARGWTWGGRWDRPDAMHCQFATSY